jgi:hypothetical protein
VTKPGSVVILPEPELMIATRPPKPSDTHTWLRNGSSPTVVGPLKPPKPSAIRLPSGVRR